MEALLADMVATISNNIWLAFVAALVAGIISSFSPCVLSAIPLVIGYVGGYAGADRKRAFTYSLVFCSGLTFAFTVLGAVSAVIGEMLQGAGMWWYIILGLIMMAVALQMLDIIDIVPQHSYTPGNKKGLAGAFLLGMLGGALSSPCATPALVAILTVVAGQGNLALGVWLLAAYAIGHCTLLLIAGTSVGFIQKLAQSPATAWWGKVFKTIFGIIALLTAFYMFYIAF